MAKQPGLVKRGGVYYYRIRVPLDLVEVFKKKEIKVTLKTEKYEEAKQRGKLLAVEWDARLRDARKHPSPKPPSTMTSLVELERMVQQHVEEWDRDARLGYLPGLVRPAMKKSPAPLSSPTENGKKMKTGSGPCIPRFWLR